jgi:pteridine reductase
MERPLEGKVALVTGGGVRVGRAIAETLGRAGASVAVHYHRSEQGAAEAVAAIGAEGNRAQAFAADLNQSAQAEALVAQVERALGPVRVLINSAALFHRSTLVDTTDEVLDQLWAVNTRGPYRLTRAVVRRMGEGGGEIVNVVDVGGAVIPWANYSAYCMTKAALAALTRCWALELAPRVRVNAVAPGTVLPPVSMTPAELDLSRQRIPQRRLGSPDDVAQAVLFLVTGPAYVTGQILAVDGGRSLGVPVGE